MRTGRSTNDPLPLEVAAIEIAPEPTEAEREAILAALARDLRARNGREPGAWWAAGLADGADDES